MRNYFSLLILLTFSIFGWSQKGIPDAPNPPKLVNNLSKEFPSFLSPDEESKLEEKLETFAKTTSNQLVVVIIDDLEGYEPAEFAYELGDKWKVGQEKEDNGIVVLIKPTSDDEMGRKYFIATGKGLEAAIPDITCRQIEEDYLKPNLKAGNYFDAIDQTTDALMQLAKGEFNTTKYTKKNKKDYGIIVFVFIAIIVFFIFMSNKGGNDRGGRGGMTFGSGGFFFGGGFGGGGFGGGSSGGSGGFGDFGGGSFGGGGAGGDW